MSIIDKSIKELKKTKSKWLEKKFHELKKNPSEIQVASNLGELVAFEIFHNSFLGKNLECKMDKGVDFQSKIKIGNKEIPIYIEVNTPMGRRKKDGTINTEKTVIDCGTEISQGVKIQTSTCAPFGYPSNLGENLAAEVISQLVDIKESEKQFKENGINILFINLLNPFFFSHIEEHGKPILYFRNELFYGTIWASMYAKQGDRIFDRINRYETKSAYELPYNGRFYKYEKTSISIFNKKNVKRPNKIDFIFVYTSKGLFIFEKLLKHKIKVDKDFYNGLFSFKQIE